METGFNEQPGILGALYDIVQQLCTLTCKDSGIVPSWSAYFEPTILYEWNWYLYKDILLVDVLRLEW